MLLGCSLSAWRGGSIPGCACRVTPVPLNLSRWLALMLRMLMPNKKGKAFVYSAWLITNAFPCVIFWLFS
ncbi:hypothetical protein BIV59_09860 [Bacillus sp. MUM 13]|nr:hypothetical protein BIV59_09860 [Bacillus sp. MUM 13]